MKVAGLEITRKKGTKKPDTGSTVSQALNVSNFGAFFKDVEHLHNNGGGKVSVLKLKTPSSNPKRVDYVDISDVVAEEDFLQHVLDTYKASIYKFQLWDSRKDLHSEHHFTLGEPKDKKDKKGKKGKKGKGGKSGKGSKTFQEEMTLLMMEKAFESKTSSAEEWQRTLELAKALKGDNGITPEVMMNFGIQLAGILQGQGGNPLEDAVALVELLQRLQIQPQPEESMSSLLNTGLQALLAMKSGPGGLTPQQQQDMQFIQQMRQRLTSGAVAGAPGNLTQQPPAPGASASGGGLGGAVESTGSAAPPAREGTQEYFNERFVRPFQRDVANDEKDDALAYQIVSMIFHARDRMADNPPPLVADFLTADTPVLYEAALQKFFGAIPELANLTQKQIAIRTVLLLEFMPLFQQSEAEEVQEAQPIIHIDQEQVVEEASIHDADRESVGEAASAEGTGDADLGDDAPDHSELQHEAVPSEVG